MAVIRAGHKGVLLVVDVQVGVMRNTWGYDLTLVKDAHTTETIELENGISIEAANVIRELNIVMTWLRYPDRTNGTAGIEEVDFSDAGGSAG